MSDDGKPNAMGGLGLAGRIAKQYLTTEITPLLALVGLLLGLFAIVVTPREEEPQIDVTFANVFIPFPGATVKEVENLVTTPAERMVSEVAGVKHIYSATQPGMAVLTVRFKVGEPRNDAIVRLYNAFYSNQDWQPAHLGVGQALIKPKGIDDVPVVAATLWSTSPDVTPTTLTHIAKTLQTDLQRVPGTRVIDTLGARERVVHITLDPARLASYQLTLGELRGALSAANASRNAGEVVSQNTVIDLQAGTFLTSARDVADVVVGVFKQAPVYLRDVARVEDTVSTPTQQVTFGAGLAGIETGLPAGRYPAVTLAVGKKPGENAVEVASQVIERLTQLRNISIPENVALTITRDYGATAKDKAQTLIKKLIFATLSVVVLVLFALGRREALVVGAAVVVTLGITLFASWAWGFTLNRVSLFALIFSIGILVDDAIVVVENIHRHLQMGAQSLTEAIPKAVDEVGGPTILATFTVIAALLPMAFVTGLMGPYMLPIPINASTGMLISLAVAFMFTPWLYRRLFQNIKSEHKAAEHAQNPALFNKMMMPFLNDRNGRRNRWLLLAVLMVLIAGAIALTITQSVILKMLPFDNKSEFQIVVDMPEGTALEATQATLEDLANYLDTVPEVTHYQLYSGNSAPINFNGLVRQYYLRTESHQGDIQVNLLDKHARARQSHEIALSLRKQLVAIGKTHNANVKMVEVPPGPPVLAPLVAEVYGYNDAQREATAKQLINTFAHSDGVVEVDSTLEAEQTRWILAVDQARAAALGVTQMAITQAIAAAFEGEDMAYLHTQNSHTAVPIRVELPSSDKGNLNALQSLHVRASSGDLVPLSAVTRQMATTREATVYHKDLQPVMYVTADVTGTTDSPLYGLAAIQTAIDPSEINTHFISTPEVATQAAIKWDGEWQVTFETFRDMGAAYAVGLILIYLLVVAQFRSYGLPLIIMAPIPLTIIGILPGHALLGQQFTAPSMIGMIALAGIIVRNSILLVDFIQQEVAAGKHLRDATISAAAVRAKPITLTALAAMMGGFFILDDPIFGGLAVSLIFGLLVSTVLTLLVIPVVYYHYFSRGVQR